MATHGDAERSAFTRMDGDHDVELERLRAERMKQLKEQSAGFVSLHDMYDQGATTDEVVKMVQKAKDRSDGMGLGVVPMEPKAVARLEGIKGGLHGVEKARRIEAIIKRMDLQGQLGGRSVTEAMVLKLLDAVSAQYEETAKPAVSGFTRGRPTRPDSDTDTDSD